MQLDILSFLTRMIINLHTNMAPSSTKTAPIKLAVLGALGMAFAWGVIAGSVGECLLVNIGNVKCPPTALPTRPQRTHQVQSREKSPEKVGSLAYSPHNQCRWYKPSIPIITSRIPNARFADVFHSGIVVTTVSALIALISFLFIAHLLLLPYDRITRTFRIQGGLLAFLQYGSSLPSSLSHTLSPPAARTSPPHLTASGFQLVWFREPNKHWVRPVFTRRSDTVWFIRSPFHTLAL